MCCITGHPSAEVRGRALESLEFKWKYGLIRAEDLLQVGWLVGGSMHHSTAQPVVDNRRYRSCADVLNCPVTHKYTLSAALQDRRVLRGLIGEHNPCQAQHRRKKHQRRGCCCAHNSAADLSKACAFPSVPRMQGSWV